MRRRIGIMMQEVALSPVMRPREFLAQVASYYPTPYDVESVIQRLVDSKSVADRTYKDLSGGQKRQVQFAMAIVGRPELLFLDEPSAASTCRRARRSGRWCAISSTKAARSC